MGRPKDSTWYTDAKIIQALAIKPRKFSEFEWAIVEQFDQDFPNSARVNNPAFREKLVQTLRIPRKTLARRLKELVSKGWVIRRVLPEHGHHVEYSLNFSKRDEILEKLPIREPRFTKADKRFYKTLDAIYPLEEELPGLKNLPYEKVLDVFFRLHGGEWICPNCLRQGKGEDAMNVLRDEDGRFYCRSCSEEILPEECNELLSEIRLRILERDLNEAFKYLKKRLDAIGQ